MWCMREAWVCFCFFVFFGGLPLRLGSEVVDDHVGFTKQKCESGYIKYHTQHSSQMGHNF